MVYLLGLEKYLVGVSDDCDFPPQVKKLPKVTKCLIDQNLSSKEIDEKVKTLQHQGINVSHLDENLLRDLKPNLILTQDICSVCAVSYTQVQKAARILDTTPSVILSPKGEGSKLYSSPAKPDQNDNLTIISLEPESVEDILDNILLVGDSSGKSLESRGIIKSLKKRIENCKLKTENLLKPKVLVIEWLEPIMVAGHWVPEMVQKAGGKMLVTKPGDKSQTIDLMHSTRGIELNPDILIISPCGFDIDRTLKEKQVIERIVQYFRNVKVYLVDGNSYMTRPGPRIIDGIEILSEVIHPEIFPRIYTNKDWVECQ